MADGGRGRSLVRFVFDGRLALVQQGSLVLPVGWPACQLGLVLLPDVLSEHSCSAGAGTLILHVALQRLLDGGVLYVRTRCRRQWCRDVAG
ncbi:hypothetical protein BGM19_02230 [Streptomyces agglomeratus]|nr:hypothetical protein BGM19_02230 [Streptomyces agglomeratus]